MEIEVEKLRADRGVVYKIIEDHWRTVFETDCTSDKQIDALEDGLRYRLGACGGTLPDDEQRRMIEYVQVISKEFSDECERDARGLRHRLCGPVASRNIVAVSEQSAVHTVVDTAVRATIWQFVASMFGRR